MYAIENTTIRDKKMQLKDMLKRDFDVELNISGGYGQSPDDPIVVLNSNKANASLTEMRVLNAIGKGRGIIWKTLSRSRIIHMERSLEKIKIETKEVNETQIITQKENYYFDVNDADVDEILPVAIVYWDNKINFELPYEVGCLHFNRVIDNELTSSGLGKSIYYGSLGIKATVYLYDKNLSDIDVSNVHSELEMCSSELVEINPTARCIGKDRLSTYKTLINRTFIINGDISILMLGAIRGKFIKLRITFTNDPFVHQNVDQFLTIIEKILITTKCSIYDLYSEYVEFYQNLAKNDKRIPKSISGVDERGKQFVFFTDGFKLDHIERDNFMKVILQEENSMVYAYGSLMLVYNENDDSTNEQLVIVSATKEKYIQGIFSVIRQEGGSIILKLIRVFKGDNPYEYPMMWFLSNKPSLSELDRLKYIQMWKASRDDAMYQQR